jgi:hypothetical protein
VLFEKSTQKLFYTGAWDVAAALPHSTHQSHKVFLLPPTGSLFVHKKKILF